MLRSLDWQIGSDVGRTPCGLVFMIIQSQKTRPVTVNRKYRPSIKTAELVSVSLLAACFYFCERPALDD